MSQWLQHLVAGAKYGSVSDATIQGYLRSASQIETVWQQLDEKVDDLLLGGMAPWEAHASMGYALAYVRACRLDVIFAQELLKASAVNKETGAGKIARLTYNQALALCEHIEPYLEESLKASANPQVARRLPLDFGPHITDQQGVSSVHVQGCMLAAEAAKSWTEGVLAKYELAMNAAKLLIPQVVTDHIKKMHAGIELGNFHLRTGVDLIGQLSQGQTTEALAIKAEGMLWEAMEGFYQTIQLVAMPGAFGIAARKQTAIPAREEVNLPREREHEQESHGRRPLPPSLPTPPRRTPEQNALDLLGDITAVSQNQEERQKPSPGDVLEGIVSKTEAPPKKTEHSVEETMDLLSDIMGKQEEKHE